MIDFIFLIISEIVEWIIRALVLFFGRILRLLSRAIKNLFRIK